MFFIKIYYSFFSKEYPSLKFLKSIYFNKHIHTHIKINIFKFILKYRKNISDSFYYSFYNIFLTHKDYEFLTVLLNFKNIQDLHPKYNFFASGLSHNNLYNYSPTIWLTKQLLNNINFLNLQPTLAEPQQLTPFFTNPKLLKIFQQNKQEIIRHLSSEENNLFSYLLYQQLTPNSYQLKKKSIKI